MICKTCKREIKIYALGLCKNCYRKQLKPVGWSKNFRCCVACGTTSLPHLAQGLCTKCYKKDQKSDVLCACGCGEFVTLHRGKPKKYVQGHWIHEANKTLEWRQAISERSSGKGNPCYGLFGKDHPAYGHETTEKTRQLRRSVAINRIKNFDKSKRTGIEKIVSSWLIEYGIVFEEQKIINDKFVVDFYVPSANLIIETNGNYWHGYTDNVNIFVDDLSEMQIKNVLRDGSKKAYLHRCGYKYFELWESDINKFPDACKSDMIGYIRMFSSQ